MFDTIRVGGGTHHHSVTERRAPTDESVRLLSEFEDKAERRVIERGKLEENTLKARWTIMYDKVDPDVLIVYCRYDINGNTREFSYLTRPSRFSDPSEKMTDLRDKLAKEIAMEVLEPLVRNTEMLKTIAGRS